MLSLGDASGISGGIGIMGPFDAVYEQPKRFVFKMPRVVPDQKHKFENDEMFRRLGREGEVRYTAFRDRPQEERRVRFQNGCREGHTELAFVATGTNIQLIFNTPVHGYGLHHHHHHHLHHQQSHLTSGSRHREIDFDKEHGKVHIRSHFIMNGVCVCWRGYIDLERLDGIGCLEFDEERAAIEDAMLRDQIDRYHDQVRHLDDRHRSFRGVGMPSHVDRRSGNGNSGVGSGTAGNHGQSLEMFSNG